MRSGIDLPRGRARHAASQGSASVPGPTCGSRLLWRVRRGGSNHRPRHDADSINPALAAVQLRCVDNFPSCSALRARIAPLFSQSYKSLVPQTLSFDILTKRRGACPEHSRRVYPLKGYFRCRAGLNPFCFILLRALLHARKMQLSCFQLFARSFSKTPGWGYPSAGKIPSWASPNQRLAYNAANLIEGSACSEIRS